MLNNLKYFDQITNGKNAMRYSVMYEKEKIPYVSCQTIT